MHRLIILAFSIVFGHVSLALTDTLKIKGYHYIFEVEAASQENELGGKATSIIFKSVSTEGIGKYRLKHTSYRGWGDCNSESIEMGGYMVTDTSLIMYSFWCHMGDAPVSPWGGRKQVYVPNEQGQLEMVYSELFVEASENGWEGYEGSIYLNETPNTEEEKQQYKDYIHKVEKEYNANFVYGKQADDLLLEVKTYLKVLIHEHTSHWDPNFGMGFKR